MVQPIHELLIYGMLFNALIIITRSDVSRESNERAAENSARNRKMPLLRVARRQAKDFDAHINRFYGCIFGLQGAPYRLSAPVKLMVPSLLALPLPSKSLGLAVSNDIAFGDYS